MVLTEQMLEAAATVATGSTKVVYQGQEIEFAGPYQRLALLDALSSVGGVDPALITDNAGLTAFAEGHGISLDKRPGADISLGKLITKVFDHLVEPRLIQPTFITGYPVEVSPLSRRSPRNPELTERFELFIAGREIANGFSELNDPVDQKDRFVRQVESRELEDHEAQVDED